MSSLAKGTERLHQCIGIKSKSADTQLSRNSPNLKLALTQCKSSLFQENLLQFWSPDTCRARQRCLLLQTRS